MIDQDSPHQLSGDTKEVRPALPVGRLLANEFEISLMYQGGGLKSVVVAFAPHVRATPTVGQIFSILSTGNANEEIMTHSRVPLPPVPGVTSDDDPNEWIAHVYTSGPTTFQVLDVTLSPGGYTGWHSHPAVLLSSMISGSLEWYDAQCNKHVYNVGDSWTENTSIHDVRNVGTANARFMITYIIAKGQPRRIDQPAPPCAAALRLE